MLIASIKRYLKRRRRSAEPAPVRRVPLVAKNKKPEILWQRERRPQDLGTLKQELGLD